VATAPCAGAVGPNPLTDLVDAAAQRLQTADQVAAFKWLTKGSVEDPARADQVLASAASDATSAGIDADYIRRVFNDQIHANEGVQYGRFSWWKLDPAAAPTVAPDLSASRATINGLNHTIVEQAAAQWPLLHSSQCAAERDDAVATVSAARQLDDLYRQALTFAAGSLCGA
jgi:chorismate mutase